MTVHLTILIKKLDSLTDEQFHAYWSNEHPKIWGSVPIVQAKIVKYSQFHVDAPTTAALRAAGLPLAEYDGEVEMWADSMEDLMAVFQDEEYLRVVVPDEESFLKRSEAVMMLGNDEVKWDNGKKAE
ncbi:hypothetical protein BP6252_05053 [Coleophoma cylindrospora]|uniref:EthD domain-containing protein n=1 Tax=Coleophoma cylindrospora TaxID=1849047 RepID=A0A3D8RSS2_9HELO|nr:hypothetical protein BP6252_05053 [Coleophoma cylindrospora]